MLLFCDARALDETMALKSLAIVGENPAHVFAATYLDDPAAVRAALRSFIADVTDADGGKTPVVAIEGFGFDEPVPKLIFEKAHGCFPFPSLMGPLVRWMDISPSADDRPPRQGDLLATVQAMRDEYMQSRATFSGSPK